MTTTVTKVDTKWETKRTQETAANIVSSMYVSVYKVLSQFGEQAR